MTVSFDISNLGHNSGVGSITVTLTTRQPNEILLVGVNYDSNNTLSLPSATGLTFTQLQNTAIGGSTGIAVFSAPVPTAAAYSILVSTNSTNSLGVILAGFYETDGSVPALNGSSVIATGSNSTPTVNITTTVANCMLWAFSINNSSVVQTAGGTFNLDRAQAAPGTSADEYLLVTSATTYTAAFGSTVALQWGIVALAIAPPSGAALYRGASIIFPARRRRRIV